MTEVLVLSCKISRSPSTQYWTLPADFQQWIHCFLRLADFGQNCAPCTRDFTYCTKFSS